MLTLFRIATFEDWTDVMYETMEIYPLSWIYYLSFIFLTAFIFLNMMVGVVLEVMTKESADFAAEHQDEDTKPASKGQIKALQAQIATLSEQLANNKS